MNTDNSKNSEDIQLDTGLRWLWGAALGLVGSTFVDIGMAEAGWSIAGAVWALLGVAMIIKAVIMLKEVAKILAYVALGMAVVALVISIISSIELTTPITIIIGAIIIAMTINNKR